MRISIAGLFAACIAVSVASASDRREELFAAWLKAQTDFQSLVVQFRLETTDIVADSPHEFDGTFRLLRTAAGDLYGSYTTRDTDFFGLTRAEALLVNRSIYLLYSDRKQATRIPLSAGELPPFLEAHFNPLLILLDHKRAESELDIKVVKQDEWYTYVTANLQKKAKRSDWSSKSAFHFGRIAVMRKGFGKHPRKHATVD
jgi:hypothetical protein